MLKSTLNSFLGRRSGTLDSYDPAEFWRCRPRQVFFFFLHILFVFDKVVKELLFFKKVYGHVLYARPWVTSKLGIQQTAFQELVTGGCLRGGAGIAHNGLFWWLVASRGLGKKSIQRVVSSPVPGLWASLPSVRKFSCLVWKSAVTCSLRPPGL